MPRTFEIGDRVQVIPWGGPGSGEIGIVETIEPHIIPNTKHSNEIFLYGKTDEAPTAVLIMYGVKVPSHSYTLGFPGGSLEKVEQ